MAADVAASPASCWDAVQTQLSLAVGHTEEVCHNLELKLFSMCTAGKRRLFVEPDSSRPPGRDLFRAWKRCSARLRVPVLTRTSLLTTQNHLFFINGVYFFLFFSFFFKITIIRTGQLFVFGYFYHLVPPRLSLFCLVQLKLFLPQNHGACSTHVLTRAVSPNKLIFSH